MVHDQPDALLMYLVKARRPEGYRERFDVEAERSMGDSVTAEISAGLSDEKLAQPKQATDLVKRACLSGSTFCGSCLKIGWVGLGLHLEFHAGDQWIIHVTRARDRGRGVSDRRTLLGDLARMRTCAM